MARANTRTLLSLDRFFQIIGMDPLTANGLVSAVAPAGHCESVMYQYQWQHAQQVGREEVADAIRHAEDLIRAEIGYPVAPDWIAAERVTLPRAYAAHYTSLVAGHWGYGPSVRARNGHIITGGRRASTLVAALVGLTYTDEDGDGYFETATLDDIATTLTEPCELRVYFPGQAGADAWEIRPAHVSINAGIASIVVRREQCVDPDLWEARNADSGIIDADDDANFLTEADVYRVYNDPSAPIEFLWEASQCDRCGGAGCPSCEYATQGGCIRVRDERLGSFTYAPATWDALTSTFAFTAYTVCRIPDYARLWYRAGYQPNGCAMDPYLERTVALLAVALLEGDLCNCASLRSFFDDCRIDLALNDGNTNTSYVTGPNVLACPWGTRKGAVMAWRRVQAEGWKVPR